jgi:uncharacterized integral membrane protein
MDIKPSSQRQPKPLILPQTPVNPQVQPNQPSPQPSKSPTAARIESVVFALLLLVLFVFGLQNLQIVTIRFIIYRTDLPLGVALLIAAMIGGLLVALLWAIVALRKKLKS